MIALGLLIDPENQELLYQMSLLETGKPTQRFSQTSPKEPLLKKLREISLRKENSTLLNNLLHASMVAIQIGLLQFDCFLGKNKGERGQNRFREHCLGIRTVPQESEIGSHSFIILYAGRRDTKRDSLQFAGGQNMEADQLANQANLVRDFSKDIQIDLQSTWNLRRQAREQTAHLAFLENQRRRSDH